MPPTRSGMSRPRTGSRRVLTPPRRGTQPTRDTEGTEQRREAAAWHAGDGQYTAHSSRVLQGQLEGDVDPQRPAHDGRRRQPEGVQDRPGIGGVVLDLHSLRIPWTLGSPESAV